MSAMPGSTAPNSVPAPTTVRGPYPLSWPPSTPPVSGSARSPSPDPRSTTYTCGTWGADSPTQPTRRPDHADRHLVDDPPPAQSTAAPAGGGDHHPRTANGLALPL